MNKVLGLVSVALFFSVSAIAQEIESIGIGTQIDVTLMNAVEATPSALGPYHSIFVVSGKKGKPVPCMALADITYDPKDNLFNGEIVDLNCASSNFDLKGYRATLTQNGRPGMQPTKVEFDPKTKKLISASLHDGTRGQFFVGPK